jgi:hypothetical protein
MISRRKAHGHPAPEGFATNRAQVQAAGELCEARTRVAVFADGASPLEEEAHVTQLSLDSFGWDLIKDAAKFLIGGAAG